MQSERLQQKVRALGPWFHQIDLGGGIKTRSIAPSKGPQPTDHPLPRWEKMQEVLPQHMHGMKVLDIGCSDGFFSIEMARRGAQVLAVDNFRWAIRRLRWATKHLGIKGIRATTGDIYTCRQGYMLRGAIMYRIRHLLWRCQKLLTGIRSPNFDYVETRFDLVFMFALLYHLPAPLEALEELAPLSDVLFIETIGDDDEEHSHIRYQPPMPGTSARPKWVPTTRCIKDMLRWVGYLEIVEISGPENERPIYLAYKPGADMSRWNLPVH